MCTFANSEDPDEKPHNAIFHQGVHCLLGPNQKEMQYYINTAVYLKSKK